MKRGGRGSEKVEEGGFMKGAFMGGRGGRRKRGGRKEV